MQLLDKLKGVTIGTAITSLIAGVIYSIARMLTDDAIKWGCIGGSLFFLALFISWGFTEFYKQGYVLSFKGLSESEIRSELFRIRVVAILSAGILFTLEGLVPLFVSGLILRLDHDLVVWVNFIGWALMWLFIALFVGFSSPALWWVTFKLLVPYFEKKELGINVDTVTRIDRDPNTGLPYAIKEGQNKTEFLDIKPKENK